MDRHKSLHKDNSRNTNINQRINQERRSIRANERKDRFLLSRNIEASPNPQILTENTNETNQIGVGKQVIDGENAHSSRIALVANKTEGAKLTRQEMFLKRFIDWKATKKHQEAVKRQNKEFERKPFIAAGSLKMGVVRNDTKATVPKTVKSFAPKKHKFKAPEGIENKAPNYKPQCTTANNAKQRQSFYTVVLTPDKKKPEKNVCGTKDKILTNKNTLAASKQQKGERFQIQSSGQVPNSVVTSSGAKPKIGPASTWALSHSNKRVLPRMESHKFVKPPPLVLSQKTKSSTSVARVVKPVTSTTNRFIPGTKPGGGGAVGKIKKLLPHDTKPKVKHAVPMKAKKSNTASRQPATNPNLNKKTLLAFTQYQSTIAETPTDVTNVNPYSSFVTSTKLKSSSKSPKTSFLDIDPISCEISPVEALEEDLHVKRTILPNTEGDTKPLAKAQEASNTSEGKSKKSKFNFVRYSAACSLKEAENTMYVELNNENIETKPDRIEQTQADIDAMPMLKTEDNIANKITSEGSPIEKVEAPIYYLSPYVSVSRGKGSLKKEREKRNSVYVLENQLNNQSPALGDTDDKAISLSVRRTLETIRYFRKQLTDEIARLHTICDQWEAYKLDNLECLQANGGEDMINVAIGQTKLLTSKKFMQFSGLIDRCERGATSEANIINDGSEDTKPITSVDLEGFWSMVGLQIENVEKRFHNLELWRDNDWIDPEEVKPKATIKKNSKVQKPKSGTTTVGSKAKPSSGLQKMLRKMHADMRKKKALGVESTENDIILTPSRKHHTENNTRQSTPRRISILVKNKKLHSPSPTILTIYTPRRRSSFSRRQSILPQESPELASHVNDFKKSLTNLQNAGERNELWMHALKGADQQRKMSIAPIDSPSINKTPLGLKGRKSILKTPGTAKGNAKNVIFNEKLRIKKFKFTIESDEEEADVNKSANEEENTNKIKILEDSDEQGNNDDLRTYTLRTRKVRLRPSGDIEIPKH